MRTAMSAMPLEENAQMSAWALKSTGMDADRQVLLRWAPAWHAPEEAELQTLLSEAGGGEMESQGPTACLWRSGSLGLTLGPHAGAPASTLPSPLSFPGD